MAFLNSYQLSPYDLGLSALGGFSALPYSVRHWETSQKKEMSSSLLWGHRTLALLEAIPVAGLLIALIERVAALFFQQKPSPSSNLGTAHARSPFPTSEGGSVSRSQQITLAQAAATADALRRAGVTIGSGNGAAQASGIIKLN